MTITQQLADALRAILPFAERDVGELAYLACDDDSEDEAMDANADVERAREALAAYDAQQAVPPTCNPIAPGETIGETVDRLLGMADQFLEDWRESVDDDTARDSDLDEREKEWEAVRPLILQRVNAHDTLVSALRTILADKGSASFNDDLEAYDAAIQTASDALAQAGVSP